MVLARVRGPKARKSTRWWVTETKDNSPQGTEFKALDPDYVVPAKLAGELAGELEGTLTRIAESAVTDVDRRLGQSNATVADGTIEKLVRLTLPRLHGLAERHAAEVRRAVLDADVSASDLDELIEMIETAHRRGGNWLLMAGRTLANALRNDAALTRGRALGVTHTQWLSKRDARVRGTHVIADGQLRPIGAKFKVGKHELRFPGDPSGLPQSWPEVAGCRCGLLMRKPGDAARKMLAMAQRLREDEDAPRAALEQVRGAAAQAVEGGEPDFEVSGADGRAVASTATYLTTDKPMVAFRVLAAPIDVHAGQTLELPGTAPLALAPPADPDAVVLTVVIPAGALVGAAEDVVFLGRGTRLEILGADENGVTAQIAT